jgi:tetratricopeptide (TPR) repeat protein
MDEGARATRRLRTAVKAVALVCVLGAKYATCLRDDALDCARAVRDGNDGLAAVVCEREYAQTRVPATGARLANALRRGGNLQGATAISTDLLATTARADAMQILGKIAFTQNRLDAGRTSLENARALHLAESRPDQVAVDDQALAGIFVRQNQFAEALRALDACILESRQAADTVIEGYCHMSAGIVLGLVGYFAGAHQELELARPLLTADRDLASLALERAGLDQYYGFGPAHQNYNAAAVAELETAIEHARRAALPSVERSAELNLVYSLAELGRTDEATRHLELARMLDTEHADDDDRAMLQARIAYRRGDTALATSLNTSIYEHLGDDDNRVRVCVMQARVALAANDLELAATWARRGIAVAEAMRGAQSALELRSWVLSTRREPYELLFTALARGRRFDDALVVFDQWQARTLLDALARDGTREADLRTAAMHTETLHRAFATLSSAPVMKPVDPAELRARLHAVDLVALVVAEDRLWRVVSRHGALAMQDLGAFADWDARLARFRTTPTDAALADALGVPLLGADVFRETDDALYAVLDTRVAGLPLVALRRDGVPLIARRPVIRPPRLSELSCTQPDAAPHRAVVLADARDDLPLARQEAKEVAGALGATPQLGAGATRAALFSASHDDILHVAVHANVDLGGGSLVLYDQPVSALEIAARRDGPALVVLSACSSAAADDGEQATSLATAFLASGSSRVVATLRPVSDAGARELATAFYRQDGPRDPARVIARIQAALARTRNPDWPSFALFGHDACRKEPP